MVLIHYERAAPSGRPCSRTPVHVRGAHGGVSSPLEIQVHRSFLNIKLSYRALLSCGLGDFGAVVVMVPAPLE